jgi:hypothetical protein
MSKIRVGYKDGFIDHVTNADNISEKYHFDFNRKWVVNNSDTKRIAVRKIKVYSKNLTAEVGLLLMNLIICTTYTDKRSIVW